MSVALMWVPGQLGEANRNHPTFAEGLDMWFMGHPLAKNRGTHQAAMPLTSIDMYIASRLGIRRT